MGKKSIYWYERGTDKKVTQNYIIRQVKKAIENKELAVYGNFQEVIKTYIRNNYYKTPKGELVNERNTKCGK